MILRESKKSYLSGNAVFSAVFFGVLLWAENSGMAQLGASEAQIESLLGKAVKRSGDLIYYHKAPYRVVTHMFRGQCDQICIFSESESRDFPAALSEEQIRDILRVYGGGMNWVPVSRLSMNRLWSSADGKCFAIYETFYKKLVLMTRGAYSRENKSTP